MKNVKNFIPPPAKTTKHKICHINIDEMLSAGEDLTSPKMKFYSDAFSQNRT